MNATEAGTVDLLAKLNVASKFGPAGQLVGFVTREEYKNVASALYSDGFVTCSDLCAVDYLTYPERKLPTGIDQERFEIVVNLLDVAGRRRVRLRVQVPGVPPSIDSLFDIYPGVEAMEREGFDMFGIIFDGHPDLTRILMPEDWEGHPLRKDYAVGSVPVQFKEAGVRPGDEIHTGQNRQARLELASDAASTKGQGTVDRILGRIGRKSKASSPKASSPKASSPKETGSE